MRSKKIVRALLLPHPAVLVLLLLTSAVLLVGSMVFIGTESVVAYISYALSAYTLTVWCLRIPDIIRLIRAFRESNRLAIRWREDTRLRINVSLYGSLIWSSLYGAFQLWLGFYHGTFWFYSLGAYYLCLALMRFLLLKYTRRFAPAERMKSELLRYRACGMVFLFMNIALSLIIFFMVYWNRTFHHHMITAIAMAAYTFGSLSAAIVSAVKYRKYNSPVFSAAKAISLAAALVSMITLEATMLTTFADGSMTEGTRKLMLGLTGGGISLVIVAMALYMIISGTRRLTELREDKNGR